MVYHIVSQRLVLSRGFFGVVSHHGSLADLGNTALTYLWLVAGDNDDEEDDEDDVNCDDDGLTTCRIPKAGAGIPLCCCKTIILTMIGPTLCT